MATPQAFKDYIVKYRRGDRIYTTGDPGTEMYIVQRGAVEIFREADGVRVSLAIMEKGDFFGEMALIESSPHSTCAEATEDCDLIEINSTLFDKMIKGNIEIAVRMLRKLSIRLRDATRKLEESTALLARSAGSEAARKLAVAAAAAPAASIPVSSAPPGDPPFEREAPAPKVSTAAMPAQAVGGRPRPAGCHAVLLGEDGSELFQLSTSRSAIGRFDPVTGLKPEVDLSALDLNRSVSRHHARLTLEGGAYNVTEEVGALNGTFINGKKLVSGKTARVKDGDTLSFGMVKLVFREVGR
ncbi:MAG TPA: cyclic nucleotide-binding domain-containing protein [Candidatus Polarisedimenticolia bacterium]|nr:cyclic nucleotide-binding domain-containing protein [Candidatus Polarisedimenticolia bacterium]